MASYLKNDYYNDVSVIDDPQTYLPRDYVYKTEQGIEEEENIPILTGDDNIFSEIFLSVNQSDAYQKAADFMAEFTRVFSKKKTPNRSYSKFIQNTNELPDVELDWVFQYFRVSFLFSVNDEDYYCVTKYDEQSRKYESRTGPIERANYKSVAEEIMQEVG